MANEPNTKQEQVAEEAAPAPRRSKKGVVVIAAAILGGIGAGLFGVGPMVGGGAAASDSTHVAEAEHESSEGGHGAEGARGPYMIENLVLNPSGTRGTRFLLFTIGIQMADAAGDDAIKLRDAETRDRVLRVMGQKSLEQLVDMTQREGFRVEVAAALDSVFGAKKVRAVYFPQFVVQ